MLGNLKKVRMSILSLSFLIPFVGNSQETGLYMLFNTWAISFSESSEDINVLRNVNSRYFRENNDKSSAYEFMISKDSVIYHKKIKSLTKHWCGTLPETLDKLGEEVWTLNANKKQLRYDIYFDSIATKEAADYSVIYNILILRKDYMKLKVEKELYEGVE